MNRQEIKSINNTRAIYFKYYTTSTGNGKIRLTDKYFEKRISINFDHSFTQTVHIAADYLQHIGFQIAGYIINHDESGIIFMKSFQSNIQL